MADNEKRDPGGFDRRTLMSGTARIAGLAAAAGASERPPSAACSGATRRAQATACAIAAPETVERLEARFPEATLHL